MFYYVLPDEKRIPHDISVPAPAGVETIPTPTAELMLDAATALPDIDIALFAAAVADYRPAVALAGKRAKSAEPWTVALAPTTDIAKRLGAFEAL